MRTAIVFKKILGVGGIVVKNAEFYGSRDGLVLDVKPRWRKPRCGVCGTKVSGQYDRAKEPSHWRHLNFGRFKFWLRYWPRRVDCPKCGRVIVEAVPWADHNGNFTKDFDQMVTWMV